MNPIRGSSTECLRHYLAQLPPATTRAGAAARKPIMAYCRCNSKTIRMWVQGTIPIGLMLIRSRYFLESLGYEVYELRKLLPEIHAFGKLIAEGKLDPKAMLEQLKYQDDYAILAILHGLRQPTDDRRDAIRLLVQQHAVTTQTPSSAATVLTSRRPTIVYDGRQTTITTAAQLIRILQPLVAALNANEFTDEEREQLRERADRRIMSRLANDIFGLCRRDDQQDVRMNLRKGRQ